MSFLPTPNIVLTAAEHGSYASVSSSQVPMPGVRTPGLGLRAQTQGSRGRAVVRQERIETSRTPSIKRARVRENGEWEVVQGKKNNKKKAAVGKSTADLSEFGDLAGPVQFWIGNTAVQTTKETVEGALRKCAENVGQSEFSVSDIYCLTKTDNPRMKTWKVTVSARWKEHMMMGEMYPPGWDHRVWERRERKEKPDRPPVGLPSLAPALAVEGEEVVEQVQ